MKVSTPACLSVCLFIVVHKGPVLHICVACKEMHRHFSQESGGIMSWVGEHAPDVSTMFDRQQSQRCVFTFFILGI